MPPRRLPEVTHPCSLTVATPVLYMHWRRKEAPLRDLHVLRKAFAEAAPQTDARVAPVGEAFEALGKARPALELFDTDGSHP